MNYKEDQRLRAQEPLEARHWRNEENQRQREALNPNPNPDQRRAQRNFNLRQARVANALGFSGSNG